MTGRPKIGVFSFTSCEGCQLQILNLEDELLDLLRRVEIVNFREAMDEKGGDYEIALVEGSISTRSDAEEVRRIRKQADLLVTIGACAVTTGLNGMRNYGTARHAWRRVYPDREFDENVSSEVRRVSDVVEVDFEIPGCPIDRRELLDVLSLLLAGGVPRLPRTPVCDECRRAGNPCLLDRNRICFGPITVSGCRAICPSFGDGCIACRGLLPGAPVEELMEILQGQGFSRHEIVTRLGQFGSREEALAAYWNEVASTPSEGRARR